MADIKKEQERDELHRAIWAIADDLRGSVDGWDFKSYVLGTMFYRYVSENLAGYINQGEWDAGNTGFDYVKLSDAEAEEARESLIEEKGFFILPSELFCNVRKKAPQDQNLNMTLETVFSHIEDSAKGSASENSFAGLFDDFDVNSNKLGATVAKRNEKLVKLLNGVGEMNLGDVKGHDIDAFGDAYEYLMTMYASNAGKSGGEFFTPAEVSELLTRLGTFGKKEVNKVYDPACGSGSLLLKAQKVLGREGVRNGFYGQEINITTYNLCRINMFLHDVGFDRFDIACEDTLTSPAHWDEEPFDLIVSNPPYSIKWAGDDNPILINDPRFAPAGVLAPKGKADMAFIMHSLNWLSPSGAAAIVCFPGIMYRGGAEHKIRQYLIDNNFIDAIIRMPDNLFFGTNTVTYIMVLKKNKPDNKVLFIDAMDYCEKRPNNNVLSTQNIQDILDLYKNRVDVDKVCHLAELAEIQYNDYYLTIPRYIDTFRPEKPVDIESACAQLNEITEKKVRLINTMQQSLEELGITRSTDLDLQKLFSGAIRFKRQDGTDFPDWKKKKLTSLTEFSTAKGIEPHEEGQYIIMDMGTVDVYGKKLLHKKTDSCDVKLRKGDLVMPKDDIGSGLIICKTAYIDEDDKYVLGDHIYQLRFETEDPLFMHYFLNSDVAQKELRRFITGGAIKGIIAKNFKNIVFNLPSIEEQRVIAQFLHGIDEAIAFVESETDVLRSIKKSLMR